jgi:hypothetical protein
VTLSFVRAGRERQAVLVEARQWLVDLLRPRPDVQGQGQGGEGDEGHGTDAEAAARPTAAEVGACLGELLGCFLHQRLKATLRALFAARVTSALPRNKLRNVMKVPLASYSTTLLLQRRHAIHSPPSLACPRRRSPSTSSWAP